MDTAKAHQLKIARKTLQMSDAGARIMGGMTKEEAIALLRGVGLSDRQIELLSSPKVEIIHVTGK